MVKLLNKTFSFFSNLIKFMYLSIIKTTCAWFNCSWWAFIQHIFSLKVGQKRKIGRDIFFCLTYVGFVEIKNSKNSGRDGHNFGCLF